MGVPSLAMAGTYVEPAEAEDPRDLPGHCPKCGRLMEGDKCWEWCRSIDSGRSSDYGVDIPVVPKVCPKCGAPAHRRCWCPCPVDEEMFARLWENRQELGDPTEKELRAILMRTKNHGGHAKRDLLGRKQLKEAQQEAQLYDKIIVECCPFCETKCCSSGSHQVCQADFDRFDTDKDGSLSKSEVRALATFQLEHEVSDGELDKYFADMDFNHDGLVTFDEYMRHTYDGAVTRSSKCAPMHEFIDWHESGVYGMEWYDRLTIQEKKGDGLSHAACVMRMFDELENKTMSMNEKANSYRKATRENDPSLWTKTRELGGRDKFKELMLEDFNRVWPTPQTQAQSHDDYMQREFNSGQR